MTDDSASPPPAAATLRPARGRRPSAAVEAGTLVAVVGAEGRGKEMLVAIARRRFAADASLAFPRRTTTRIAAGFADDTIVSRRSFRDLAAAGAFAAAWEAGGHLYGLTAEVLAALRQGQDVVVAAQPEALAALQRIGGELRVVDVQSGADRVRGPGRGNDGAAAPRAVVRHEGDLATAVRGFHEVLAAMRVQRLDRAMPRGRGAASTAAVARVLVARAR